MEKFDFDYGQKTINEFMLLFKNRQLNLEPGFQRDSVWYPGDRKKLIESIFQNYPIPSIFLYKRNERGRLEYDVIDGKQRLETILMFQGVGRFHRMRFSVNSRLDPMDNISEWDWKRILKKGHEHRIMGYNIQTVEISGDLSDIIDLFVRINSTGKRLTGAEKRHAKFFHSEFLKEAGRLAENKRKFFQENRILTRGQISRMKHVELVCELMASIHANGPINRKIALDSILRGQSIDKLSLKRVIRNLIRTLNIVKRMFPKLRATRFANSVDFYTLCLFVWGLDREGCVLNNKKRNQQSQKLLVWLSNGVDSVRMKVKRIESIKTEQRLFADYYLTVQGQTDSLAARKNRNEILCQVLGGLFEKKEKNRGFTIEQRRLIWHSEKAQKCIECQNPLTWDNFTIDHIKPHSLGGKAKISNSALMCRSCNSRKGAHLGN